MNPASAAAWASAIPRRICWALCTSSRSCARERILDIAATQLEDGSAYHQYQPLTKKGNYDIGSGFNDDPLWLIFGVAAYIKETGDDIDSGSRWSPFDCDAEQGRAADATTCAAPSIIRRTTSARTGCR